MVTCSLSFVQYVSLKIRRFGEWEITWHRNTCRNIIPAAVSLFSCVCRTPGIELPTKSRRQKPYSQRARWKESGFHSRRRFYHRNRTQNIDSIHTPTSSWWMYQYTARFRVFEVGHSVTVEEHIHTYVYCTSCTSTCSRVATMSSSLFSFLCILCFIHSSFFFLLHNWKHSFRPRLKIIGEVFPSLSAYC